MPAIKVELSEQGIDDIIAKLDKLQAVLNDLSAPIEKLVKAGEQVADAVTANGMTTFDGDRHYAVSSSSGSHSGDVTLSGPAVAFLEFGAGVFYNGDGSNYPLPRPAGIVNIGEYGLGQGKQDMWRYGHKWTHGNPAAKPMYFASLQIEQNAVTEFKGVIENALR